MPKLKASKNVKPVATIGDNSAIALAVMVSPAFTAGRSGMASEKTIAASLTCKTLETQREAKLDVKAGWVSSILFPTVDATVDLVNTCRGILGKKGWKEGADDLAKRRSKSEHDACRAADMKVLRIMSAYDVPNLEPRGGDNAGTVKTPKQLKAAKVASLSKQVEKVLGAAAAARMVEKASGAVAGKAVLAVPAFATLKDVQAHMSMLADIASKSISAGAARMTAQQASLYRKAVATFKSEIGKLAALPLKG